MPSSLTITAFYVFSPNTRAKATQVNANFDVFRGHILPVSPATTTAAPTDTYDVGSTEYRWRGGYFNTLHMAGHTTTAHVSMSVPSLGGMNINVNGTPIKSFPPNSGYTTSAQAGGLALSPAFVLTTSLAAGVEYVLSATITVSTLGRPLRVGLTQPPNTTTTFNFTIQNQNANPSDIKATEAIVSMGIYLNGGTFGAYEFEAGGIQTGVTGTAAQGFRFSPGMTAREIFLPAGTHNLQFGIRTNASNGVAYSIRACLFAYEI